ncbi:MAG: SUMF1/EgtB/PvdO family nonheme iron enzyme, partial [bacterium]|nr:SUMF1/EgtB/PvdO family nonheme iron enzyme [bacterium]
KWLAELVGGGRLSPQERLEAGDVLGELGDPRPGVGILSGEATGGPELPAIGWVEVPAGELTMGAAEDDILAKDWEKPAHPIWLNRFRISRYPITNSQYRPFCDSDGYANREYWCDAGWEWLQGAEPDVSSYPEELRADFARWLAERPKEKRQRPFFWDNARRSAPTRPVVGVTWYEACAYCRWLEARIRELENGSVLGIDLETTSSCRVRLPTEAEWEKAARGPGAARWPWGEDFAEGLCNSEETGLKE